MYYIVNSIVGDPAGRGGESKPHSYSTLSAGGFPTSRRPRKWVSLTCY